MSGQPYTILQVLPEMETGGVEQSALDMARAIIAQGWRAVIACEGGVKAERAANAGAHVEILPMASKNPITMWRNVKRLQALCRAHKVDLIHARSRAPAWSARACARRLDLPFVTTIHGAYNAGNSFKRRYNAIMATGDRVIANSQFMADYALREFGLEPPRLVTIPRGIDLAQFDPARLSSERIIAQSKAWRLDEERPVIMLPGRLTRWKGQMVLIEAAARLVERLGHRDFLVLLVGDAQGRSDYEDELVERANALGVGGQVRLTGPARDMPAAYALAQVVVSASTDAEAFGRVSVEAQAMRRLIIATDHGGSRETVRDGETGFLVPPNDADALAAALERALKLNEATRLAMTTQARIHVAERFDLRMMTRRTLDVYRELLDHRS